jgi:nitrate/nitrite transport system substrate-binding protein
MKPPKSPELPRQSTEIPRRRFLGLAAKGLGAAALLGALPRGWRGGLYASDAPETAKMRFGIIALTDCSPIVIAHEKGLFKKYGIESTVAKGANWPPFATPSPAATIRRRTCSSACPSPPAWASWARPGNP